MNPRNKEEFFFLNKRCLYHLSITIKKILFLWKFKIKKKSTQKSVFKKYFEKKRIFSSLESFFLSEISFACKFKKFLLCNKFKIKRWNRIV
uniref:ribosomal protein L32 n=1 Tax=Hypericum monogynum TaxID=684760 RepID=UPI0022A753E0|nr:ribosomal protein L32 [Hypericum monogynum]UZS76753.1 ribosomal protein L32 [Hypericum monogynum]